MLINTEIPICFQWNHLGDENLPTPIFRVDNANNFNDKKRGVLGVGIPQRLVDSEGVVKFLFKIHLKTSLHARMLTK